MEKKVLCEAYLSTESIIKNWLHSFWQTWDKADCKLIILSDINVPLIKKKNNPALTILLLAYGLFSSHLIFTSAAYN